MSSILLTDILEKREQIMNSNNKDEYIQVPDDEDNLSTGSFKFYENKKNVQRYNLGRSMHELTQAVKLYLDKERTRKVNWAVAKCFAGFIGISGLIVLNDFIVINYFL